MKAKPSAKNRLREKRMNFLAAVLVSHLREETYSARGRVKVKSAGEESRETVPYREGKVRLGRGTRHYLDTGEETSYPEDYIASCMEQEKREMERIGNKEIIYFLRELFDNRRVTGLNIPERELLRALYGPRGDQTYSYEKLAKIWGYKKEGIERIKADEVKALAKLRPYVQIFVDTALQQSK